VKAHVEIKVRLKQLPPGGLHEVLLNFTDETEGWKFPRATSEDYQCHNGRDAGYAIFMQDGSEVAAVALANLAAKQPNTFRVPNIVPHSSSSLTIDEYNAIGIAFADAFRQWLKKASIRGSVDVVGPNRTLADVIPGERTRKFFEAWLHTPTPVSHPSDLYALDRFICHLFRHPGKTRVWEIEPYLINDLSWRPETARWVVARIYAGLELLRVDRKF
jgi:hypothetical protein